ncbi:MAG: NAD-dependent epimerase/dehydratase family protein [Planctomycetota bacterium]
MAPLCFVTGASGFLGRALVPRLARSFRLRLLVRTGQELPQFADIAHERVEARLEDHKALASGLAGCAHVVHMAALVSFRREDRAAMFSCNSDGTANLARLAQQAGVRRFLHVSTISAVGYSDGPQLLDETASYNFDSLPGGSGYSDSKHAAEQHLLEHAAAGLDAVIVNPPSMYGGGDRRKTDDSLLTAVMLGQVRLAPPGGLNVANVEDVCDGMLGALAKGRTGERYILGGENLTGRELLQRIATITGGTAPTRVAPRLALGFLARALRCKERVFGSKHPLTSEILQLATRHLWYSSDKAERDLDWRAGPVDPGIAAAFADLQP